MSRVEHIPYGYRIENGVAVIDESAAEQVQLMFENYLNGDSLIKAAEKTGIKGNHGSIKLMLQNRRYLGDGFYPPIISEETFSAAAEERESRAERLGRNGYIRKERSVNVPMRFLFESASDYFDDPVQQAEYMYGLIKTEVTNIE
ncbi:MAG: recombinase family protein [Oscillospiraceae bacterium]